MRALATAAGEAADTAAAASSSQLPRRTLYTADRRASAARLRDANAAATHARLRELLAARRSLAASKVSAQIKASQLNSHTHSPASDAFQPLPKATRHFLVGSRNGWEVVPESEVSSVLRGILREMHSALDSNHPDIVFRLFQDAQRHPSLGALHPELYNCLIQALRSLKQPRAAVEVFDSMFAHGVEPDWHTLMAMSNLLMGGNLHLGFDMMLLAHRQFEAASQDRRRFESTGKERPEAERFWEPDEMEWFSNAASASEASTEASAAAGVSGAESSSGPVRIRWPRLDDNPEEWWMHSSLVGAHISFLRGSSSIAKGHSGKEFLSSFMRNTLEPFLIAYLEAFARMAATQLHAIAAVYAQGKSAASAVDPVLMGKVSPGLRLVQSGDTIAPPSNFQWLYQQALLIESTILLRHTSRGERLLAQAEQSWLRFQELKKNRTLQRWWGAESRSAALGLATLRQFETLVAAAGDVHHGLAVLDREHEGPKERNARLAEVSARLFSDVPSDLPEPASPDVWRDRTRVLYAEFWRYLQHLLLATSSSEWITDVFQLGREIGASGPTPGTDMLKQSHVATLRATSTQQHSSG